MAIPTPEHLFAQAEGLLTLYPGRKPRQTEIRRAISASYYGVFHFMLAQAADMHVGATYRADPRYGLAYRSISHASLRSLCHEVRQSSMPSKFKHCLPAGGFGADLRKVAQAVESLQEQRHSADYDPLLRFDSKQARAALASARDATTRFRAADLTHRQVFLALLLFPPPRSRG